MGTTRPRPDGGVMRPTASSTDVSKVTAHATVNEERGNMLSRFERFSNWQRLKNAVAICLEYKRRLRMSTSRPDM